jgi:sec-independent protein translocase protein TatA
MALTDPLQWVIIAVVVVVFLMYGPKKIPELARSLGSARKEFQSVTKTAEEVTGKLKDPDALLESLARAEPEQRPAAIQSPQAPPTVPVAVQSDDALLDTARRLGIQTTGKTKEEISQEILARATASTSVKV